MTWIEKIEAAKLRRNDTAGECMAMIQALAADRDTAQGLLRKSQERINALEEESCELESEIKAQAKEYERELNKTKAMLQLAAAKVADFSGSCPYDTGLSKVCMFRDEDDCKDEYEKCWIEYWRQEASK